MRAGDEESEALDRPGDGLRTVERVDEGSRLQRVMRGGGYGDVARKSRCSYRHSVPSHATIEQCGFRAARRLEK